MSKIGTMKERIDSAIKSHHTRGTFYLLLLALAVCVIPLALAQRNAMHPRRAQARQRTERIDEKRHAFPANIIIVTNTDNSGPDSLRDALAAANDGDTIDATGVSGTILLTSGELQINHNVTINGPGAGSLAVNGNAIFRVFENFASNVTISGFTITNGAPIVGNGGAGILNHGGLTVSGSSIVNNVAVLTVGGGIGS